MKKKIMCQVQIPDNYFDELNKDVKTSFCYSKETNCYYSDFPAEQNDNGLDEYIIAYLEVALIMANPKYEIADHSHLQSDLYRLTKESNIYILSVSISHSNLDQPRHEMLLFEEVASTDCTYTLRLIGNQAIFNIA